MATTTRTTVEARRLPYPVSAGIPTILGLVCLAGGVLLALNTAQRFLVFGADAPYVKSMLALDAPVTSEVGQAFGPASGSVDNALFVGALLSSGVAAMLLLVACGFWWSSARTRHPEASRRVAAVGLWMALALAVVGFLPVQGAWQDAGLGGAGPTWHASGLQLVAVALVGLLLLQISAPQWRGALRRAFRD
ncbi:MAG: hypothetical protein K0U64_08285 [Actinomycetia bacterium]|nr:hypothetical protein [Actinomycetes bacterium]